MILPETTKSVVVTSDDASAGNYLAQMGSLAENVMGLPFGSFDPEQPQFFAGEFWLP